MVHITPAALTGWANLYVIVGSSAGALTGLQFVAMTLVAQRMRVGNMRDIHAFATPTVMHFCTALLISAIMTAPWQSLINLGICLAVLGAAGLIYSSRVVWHARKADYSPDAADWTWYVVLPSIAHISLLSGAVLMWSSVAWSLAVIAADAVLFVLIGVHNSWDTVTYLAVQSGQHARASESNIPAE
jgi:hypothetical protein